MAQRVCLVGAGFISEVHAEAISALPGLRLGAVADPNRAAAERLARKWGIPDVHESAAEAAAAGTSDRAHILVPPPVHQAAAMPFLEAGLPVFLEKPMAVSPAECEALIAAADRHGAALGVNHNFAHHPAFRALLRRAADGGLGGLEAVSCTYAMPLRQLSAGQFGHWMFSAPVNLLLEQAVHPLSQVLALAGPVRAFRALAGDPIEIAPGRPFYDRVTLALDCDRAPVQFHFRVGVPFPAWRVSALCEDGMITADIARNRTLVERRTRFLEAVDDALDGERQAVALAAQSFGSLARYVRSMLPGGGRADPFFLGMRGAITTFHGQLDAPDAASRDAMAPGLRALGAPFARDLVALVSEIAAQAFAEPASPPAGAPHSRPADAALGDGRTVILGGTGFLGRHLVRRLLEEGREIAVMARNLDNLSAPFTDPRVTLLKGDVTRAEDVDVARAIGGARVVVNLAHGGGGDGWEEIERRMVESARRVGVLCCEKGVGRLVHVGSIAGLYLGDAGNVVTDETPVDSRAEERADYARAKAAADRALLALYEKSGLPVVILRPGIVLGAGGTPFHSGFGLYNNDQHCLGWNGGRNPLPLVLAEDVARAIVVAMDAESLEGRTYNLVGDVRLTARDYVSELARGLGRPLRFHPQRPAKIFAIELAKWLVKRAGGRKVPKPSYRDLKSRGLVAAFDTAAAKSDLGWRPVSDRAAFIARAIAVHRSPARGTGGAA